MTFDNTYVCTATGERVQLTCESVNVICLITCYECLEQYSVLSCQD